jgi:hypothetical protein
VIASEAPPSEAARVAGAASGLPDAPGDASCCRLCGGALRRRFTLQVLRRHEAVYHDCVACGSLQTQPPHWLDEAYGPTTVNLDVGALQRNLDNFAFCYAFARLLGVRTAVDYGGGDGLLVRYLRDHGIEAQVHDKFASASYARGFEWRGQSGPDLLTAFEVFEHLPQPAIERESLFGIAPRFLLCSTEIYRGQGADWWYLAPEGGQHVFFYSEAALIAIGERFGYRIASVGGKLLYYRADLSDDEHRRIVVAQEVLVGWIFQAVKAWVFSQPAPGVARDAALLATQRPATG